MTSLINDVYQWARKPWSISVNFRLRGYQSTWITSQPNVPTIDSLSEISQTLKWSKKTIFRSLCNVEWSKIAIFGPLLSSGPKPCFRSFSFVYIINFLVYIVGYLCVFIINAFCLISGQFLKMLYSGPLFTFLNCHISGFKCFFIEASSRAFIYLIKTFFTFLRLPPPFMESFSFL